MDEMIENQIGQIDELETALKKGFVHFTFYKKDGTLRDSFGTRKPSCLVEVDAPMPIYKNDKSMLPFYDVVSQGWRSVSLKNNKNPRIEVIDVYSTFAELQEDFPEYFGTPDEE